MKMYPTKEGTNLNDIEICNKIVEEVVELVTAIKYKTNIGEEVLDVLQMCTNIIHKYGINVKRENLNHQCKLLTRGLNFIIKEGE